MKLSFMTFLLSSLLCVNLHATDVSDKPPKICRINVSQNNSLNVQNPRLDNLVEIQTMSRSMNRTFLIMAICSGMGTVTLAAIVVAYLMLIVRNQIVE